MSEPSVRLDNLDGGTMTFDRIAYIDSPRTVCSVKSDLLFETLDRLRDAKLPMTSPQNMVVRTLPASLGGDDSHHDKD